MRSHARIITGVSLAACLLTVWWILVDRQSGHFAFGLERLGLNRFEYVPSYRIAAGAGTGLSFASRG